MTELPANQNIRRCYLKSTALHQCVSKCGKPSQPAILAAAHVSRRRKFVPNPLSRTQQQRQTSDQIHPDLTHFMRSRQTKSRTRLYVAV
jgi:hypothetical protein